MSSEVLSLDVNLQAKKQTARTPKEQKVDEFSMSLARFQAEWKPVSRPESALT
jgi:hypothetical protein